MNLKTLENNISKLYLENNLSIRQIAKEINCSYSGVKNRLHKMNIPMRNKCASLNLCPDKLNNKEFELVVGTVLGDGHLVNPKKNGESQLYLGHSVKQKSYIEWKHSELKRFTGCKIYPLRHTLNNGKTYITLNFLTRKSHVFTEIRNHFYKSNIKTLDFEWLKDNLTTLGLSVWYMDDGYNYPDKGCEISSQCFTKQENKQLLKLLKEKFGIVANLRRIKNKRCKIYIRKQDKQHFFTLIRKWIIPSMSYKVKSPEATRQTSPVYTSNEDVIRPVYTSNEDMVRSTGKLVEVF